MPWLKLRKRSEYLHKPIVHYFHRIIVGVAVTHTNTHCKAVVEFIELPLALPVCLYTTLDNIFELLPVWQSFRFCSWFLNSAILLVLQ